MTPERWKRVREIFDSAIELPPAEAREFAHRACAGDAGLEEEAARMLEQHWHSGPLDHPVPVRVPEPGSQRSGPVFQPDQVAGGRYRIVRYISRGGMGEVYEARDPELGVTVALKTLLPEIADDETMIARFKREIALSREVAHPNVCKVFDLALHREEERLVVFLSMEFLAGETLAAKLKRDGAMTEAEALPLLEQMAAALDASHAQGVIHRDFKPANVMLVPSHSGLRAVVTDFGLARKIVTEDDTTATLSRNIEGTLDYMAPELLAGAPASVASDIYALGMTAYKMVAGSLPFSADTPAGAAVARMCRPIPSPRVSSPGLDAYWERSVLRALDPKPANRFSSATHFAAALRGEATSSTIRIPALTRRRTALAVGVIVAGAAGIAGWRAYAGTRHRLPKDAEVLYREGAADIAAEAYFAADKALDAAVKIAPHAPQIRARLAEALVELDSPEEAKNQMLIAQREDLSWLSKADRLRIDAIDLAITHQYGDAAAKYAQIERETGGSAEVEVDLGRAYSNAGKPDDAIRSFRRAAEGPEHSPAAWLRLGALYAQQLKRSQAEDAFSEAERLFQMANSLEGLGELALERGIAATRRGELEAGANYLHTAIDIAKHAGNLPLEIQATLRLSTNAYIAGDGPTAEGLATGALESARSHQLNTLAIRGLITIGAAMIRKQNYAEAERRYHEALELAEQNHAAHLVAVSHLSLAALYDRMKQRTRQYSEAKEALAFYRPNHYANETLQCLEAIGRYQRDAGEYDAALASFREMLQTAEALQARQQMAEAHENLGTLLFDREHFPEALEHYRKNLELAVDPEKAGYAALQCGNTLWRLGHYEEAQAMFDKADETAPKFPALSLEVLYSRAGMLLSQNRYREAAEKARAAAAIPIARSAETDAQLNEVLGLSLVRAGNKFAGLTLCQRAWDAERADTDASDQMYAGLALVEASIAAGKREAALEIFGKIEAELTRRTESEWRAYALLSALDSNYKARAANSLAELSRQWGEGNYNTYRARPDIERLARPFRPAFSASK